MITHEAISSNRGVSPSILFPFAHRIGDQMLQETNLAAAVLIASTPQTAADEAVSSVPDPAVAELLCAYPYLARPLRPKLSNAGELRATILQSRRSRFRRPAW
jgi:hypothetical protein